MTRFWKQVWVIGCLSGFLAACGPSTPEPARSISQQVTETREVLADEKPVALVAPEKRTITVALLLPLSGSEAAAGDALLKAATLALFDAYDPRLKLLPLDTAGDAAVTQTVTQKALTEGAEIILGPLLASNVRAAKAVLEGHDVPLIGFSNDSSVAAPGRYIMGFLPESEIKRVVDFAIGEGLTNHAALAPVGRYGERVRAAYGEAVTDAGGTIMAIETYEPDPDLMFEPVKRLAAYDERRQERTAEIRYLRSLRDDVTDELADKLEKAEVLEPLPYDAVLVPEGGSLLRALAPLLPYYEIDPGKVKILGTGLWNDPDNLREPPLQHGYFAAPTPDKPEAFLARYKETYEMDAPRIATLGYDAVSLVAVLARQKPDENGRYFTEETLTNPLGFQGVDGLFRFLPDGSIERLLSVLEVTRKGFAVIDPAPDAFPAFGYALRHELSK